MVGQMDWRLTSKKDDRWSYWCSDGWIYSWIYEWTYGQMDGLAIGWRDILIVKWMTYGQIGGYGPMSSRMDRLLLKSDSWMTCGQQLGWMTYSRWTYGHVDGPGVGWIDAHLDGDLRSDGFGVGWMEFAQMDDLRSDGWTTVQWMLEWTDGEMNILEGWYLTVSWTSVGGGYVRMDTRMGGIGGFS